MSTKYDNERDMFMQIIEKYLKPRDLEKKMYGEVFTPPSIIIEMLDKLDRHYKKIHNTSIFSDPTLKWLEPSNGIGNFTMVLYIKLFDGLQTVIPDKKARKTHIVENMLYACEKNPDNNKIYRKIFGSGYKINLFEGDSLRLDNYFGSTHFDVIIGNPPYNCAMSSNGASPLYDKFIDYFVSKTNYLMFIIPSRWEKGGKYLDNFRCQMLNSYNIVYTKRFDDSKEIFGPKVCINGGVQYFIIDNVIKKVVCKTSMFDVCVLPKYQKLVKHVLSFKQNGFLSDIYMGRYYRIETNDLRLSDYKKSNNWIKCFVSKKKGFVKYIDRHTLSPLKYNFWKLITARAHGDQCSGFGNMFVGNKQQVFSNSYIGFYVGSMDQGFSLKSYLESAFANHMLRLRKSAQDISKSTCAWIPLVPLDRVWTDQTVYKYFELSEHEIRLIENDCTS